MSHLRAPFETKVGIFIILVVAAIFLFAIYKGLNYFNKSIDKINIQYEEIRVEEGE